MSEEADQKKTSVASGDGSGGDGKFDNPTALEVIHSLIDPAEDQKASAHMKGHISKSIIDDTFLYEAKEIYPESTLRINCTTHDAPTTFYSKAEHFPPTFSLPLLPRKKSLRGERERGGGELQW